MFLINKKKNNKKDNNKENSLIKFFKSKTFQRVLIAIVTVLCAFIIIENGAAPKKYNIKLGDKSLHDINAPRDIENKIKTEKKAEDAALAVSPVMRKLEGIPIDVLNTVVNFFSDIETVKKNLDDNVKNLGTIKNDTNHKESVAVEQAKAVSVLNDKIYVYNVHLSEEQIRYLLIKVSDEDLRNFRKISIDLIGTTMKEEINMDNLAGMIDKVQSNYQKSELSQDLKNIGILLAKAVLKPNCTVDESETEARRDEARKIALDNKEMITKDSRILSYGDIVTEDKYEILKELNLLETGNFDYTFVLGIFLIILLLTGLVILYMNHFYNRIFHNTSELVLLCVVIILTLLVARVVYTYSTLLIPVFIAPMLISILLDLKLAIIVNFVITIAISFITKGDLTFIYMAMISGTFSAFFVEKANQRIRLSVTGIVIAFINILIVISMGIINKSGLKTTALDSLKVSINGLVSIILTIGLLPFMESFFNVITPLKLLELSNPNNPLLKKLLMEAPGTYHHSLMVGNLAEVATEAINGNSLLARVGAYYHDVGKLKRPVFFKENQMSENPHDRMTPNLSTLVITSHTRDGVEVAEKYKIPFVIREIIKQHHGTTLVAYFFHKAQKGDKAEMVKQEDFRYEGPKPKTKEAAVVMLADCVEAAVRSMIDKTEGKIEGLVRKIIKDKLDDGQLDSCDLTLKDLDNIAKGFMRVFSGFFHERQQYPEIKIKKTDLEHENIDNIHNIAAQQQCIQEGEMVCDSSDRKPAEHS